MIADDVPSASVLFADVVGSPDVRRDVSGRAGGTTERGVHDLRWIRCATWIVEDQDGGR